MTNCEPVIEEEFVRLINNGEPDRLMDAFESFSSKLLDFIHTPIHWVEKHRCLVRLNAIFHVHILKTKCEITHKFLTLAISLISTMKELVIETQKKCSDALSSIRNTLRCANGQPLKWTGGTTNLYELINALVVRKCFNNGDADTADVVSVVSEAFNADIDADGCYEAKRRIKRRNGKVETKYSRKYNGPSRTYFCDDLSEGLNDNITLQEDNDGRAIKNNTK